MLFAVPQTLRSLFAASDSDYEGTVDIDGTTYDWLRVYPSTYKQAQTNREVKGLRRGTAGYAFAPYRVEDEPEITATVEVSYSQFLLLKQIERLSAASGFGGTPTLVTMRDYVQPGVDDQASAIAGSTEPFTDRLGELVVGDLASLRGNATGGHSYTEPLELTFKEVAQS